MTRRSSRTIGSMTSDARLYREYRFSLMAVDCGYKPPDVRERAARFIEWYEGRRSARRTLDAMTADHEAEIARRVQAFGQAAGEPGAALAARIHARLTAALEAADRGCFSTTLPAICGPDGVPRVTLEQAARLAAFEAAEAGIEEP